MGRSFKIFEWRGDIRTTPRISLPHWGSFERAGVLIIIRLGYQA